MPQIHDWTLAEMGRTLLAERLAEARRDHLANACSKPGPSPRVLLARVLRSLASVLDGQPVVQPQPDRPFAQAIRAI